MSRARYTAIPTIPVVGVEDWQSRVLNALKENVELLTGTRGEQDGASVAVNLSRLTVSAPPAQRLTRITASGNGVSVSGVNIPTLEDYNRALSDIQLMANDIAALRATVDTLIRQLRS